MIIIENDVIYIHKGDDGSITVNLKQDGEPYEMQTGDQLKLTVREEPDSASTVILSVTSTTNVLTIPHSATSDVDAGSYSADIQFSQGSGATITTLWPLLTANKRAKIANFKNFVIMPEVTT